MTTTPLATNINYSAALSDADYTQVLKNFMISVEGTRLAPYIDYNPQNQAVGYATIGWGFVLDSGIAKAGLVDTILQKYLGFNVAQYPNDAGYRDQIQAALDGPWPGDPHPAQPDSPTHQLQKKLNAILQARAIDPSYPSALRSTFKTDFAFANDGQVADVFDQILRKDYDDWINSHLRTAFGTDIPNCLERVALFSMRYNGELTGQFWENVKTAMSMSDPAEARANTWYEFRYDITKRHPSRFHDRAYKESN